MRPPRSNRPPPSIRRTRRIGPISATRGVRRGISDGPRTAYRRALEVDATYADAANGLGTILVQTGKPADAVQWFERAIQQAPDFYEARLNLGIALQESGQRARADQVYREILKGTGSLQTREKPRQLLAKK